MGKSYNFKSVSEQQQDYCQSQSSTGRKGNSPDHGWQAQRDVKQHVKTLKNLKKGEFIPLSPEEQTKQIEAQARFDAMCYSDEKYLHQ